MLLKTLVLCFITTLSSYASDVTDRNRALLQTHKTRLQGEISSIEEATRTSRSGATAVPSRNPRFSNRDQNIRVLAIKRESLRTVNQGLTNLDSISKFGPLENLSQVRLALRGVNPFDLQAARRVATLLGLSQAKSIGGSSGMRMGSQRQAEPILNEDCVKNLDGEFSETTVQDVCTGAGYAGSIDLSFGGVEGSELSRANAAEVERKQRRQRERDEEQRRKMMETPLLTAQNHPRYSEFLNAAGVRTTSGSTSRDRERDLSTDYYEPLYQGQTGACATYALIADAEVTGQTQKLSEGSLHGQIVRDIHNAKGGLFGITDSKFLSSRSSQSPTDARAHLAMEGTYPDLWDDMRANMVIPASRGSFSSEFLTDFSNRSHRYRIARAVSVDNDPSTPINFEMVRALIDARKPPVAWIDSDARSVHENWIHIDSGGNSAHVVNVVGYGYSDVDPKDGTAKPYFVLRDSFDNRSIHVRVDAHNFLSHLERLEKATWVPPVPLFIP